MRDWHASIDEEALQMDQILNSFEFGEVQCMSRVTHRDDTDNFIVSMHCDTSCGAKKTSPMAPCRMPQPHYYFHFSRPGSNYNTNSGIKASYEGGTASSTQTCAFGGRSWNSGTGGFRLLQITFRHFIYCQSFKKRSSCQH